MSLVVVGSVAYDGVETPHGKVDRMLGGAATYVGLSASYFAPVKIVAVVGDDFAQEDVDLLASRNIDLAGLGRVPGGKTFFWAGVYSADMNDRTTLRTDLNVFADFEPKLPDAYRSAPYLFLGNIQPDLQRSVRSQMDAVHFTGGDTMNYWINDFRPQLLATLAQWDFLLINDSEARLLSGEHNLRRAAEKIQRMGPHTLIIKRGEYGAILFHGGGHFVAPGFLLEEVFDPTGAGDCFAGGFMGYLAGQGVEPTDGKADMAELRRAVIYGSVMGSFCCEKFGVDRFRTLTRDEIEARYREFKSFTSFSDAGAQAAVSAALALLSAAAVLLVQYQGWTLYYGDADAHLMIARRMVDSQTPGIEQIGLGWLPLLHFMILPFVRVDAWWRGGLAGAVPPAACFVIGGSFFFAAVRRIFQSTAAAVAATALFALNPNVLYLQSIPMTEMVFFSTLAALLYFTVRFGQSQRWLCAAAAGIAACAGTLTRYEGWFVLPFAAAYFAIASRRRRWRVTLLFCALAATGPLAWFAFNWWITGDGLDFFRGPYSPSAIQGGATYPGLHNWRLAWLQLTAAIQLCAGLGLVALGLAGMAVCIFQRAFWPLLLLALPPAFYVASVHSGSIPIFVPTLYPHSYYNLRYGTAALPLLALAAAGLVALVPPRMRTAAACVVILAGTAYWFVHGKPSDWPVWQEASVNDAARRERVREAAAYLAPRYVRGTGIVTSFYPLTSVFREMGLPLREALMGDNDLPWLAAVQRPEFFLTQQWAIVEGGDRVQSAIDRLGRFGVTYKLETRILVGNQQVLEIYRR